MQNEYLIKRSCPNCAGPIEIVESTSDVRCPYCGCFFEIKDRKLIKKAIQEELSSKSFEEKYKNIVASEEKKKRDKETEIQRRTELQKLGLNIELSGIPLPLSDDTISLISEAIPIIKEDKWKSADHQYKECDIITTDVEPGHGPYWHSGAEIKPLVYSNVKAIFFETQGPNMLYGNGYPTGCKLPFPFKVKYPDGSVRVQYYYTPTYKEIKKPFPGILWEAKISSAKRQMLEQVHQEIEALRPYYYGTQYYVTLNAGQQESEFWGGGPKQFLYLFRDGYIFFSNPDPFNSFNVFRNVAAAEEYLLREIRLINKD